MNPIDPRIDPSLLPDGCKAVVIAEHQDEYNNLPSVRTPRGQVITRWEPTPEERRAIVEGADIFVTLLSRGPINPLLVSLGNYDFKLFEAGLWQYRADGWPLCPACGEDELHSRETIASPLDPLRCYRCGWQGRAPGRIE
jgi:hypothetical protein